jgi:hypothetical protein
MTPALYPIRWRCSVTRGAAPPSPTQDPDAQAAVAAQHAAFDERQAEHAELLRELDALETLMLAQLKNEDEIMKKWIALI